MARGDGRRDVFLCRQDSETFLGYLRDLQTKRPFRLYAYCLMTNHLHLLIEPLVSTISTVMGVLLTRYAKYFNRRLGRAGHVFEERFRSYSCLTDAYFQRSVRYIHLNPVRAGLVTDPADWPFSGHREYLSPGHRRLIDAGPLLPMLGGEAAYRQFILEGMSDGVGDGEFLGLLPGDGEVPAACTEPEPRTNGAQAQRDDLDTLAVRCATGAGIPLGYLRSATKLRDACRARREFMRMALGVGYSMTEISVSLGLSLAAVSKAMSSSGES